MVKMESPAGRIRRLTTALLELSSQTTLLLDAADYEAAAALQERSRPLVDEIARLAVQPGVASSLDADTQRLAHKLMASQAAQVEQLAVQKRAVSEELDALRSAQTRASQFKSAYSSTRSPYSATTLKG